MVLPRKMETLPDLETTMNEDKDDMLPNEVRRESQPLGISPTVLSEKKLETQPTVTVVMEPTSLEKSKKLTQEMRGKRKRIPGGIV